MSRLLSPLRLRLLGLVAVASFPAALLIGRLAIDERHATALRARDSTLRLLDSTLVEQQDLLRSGRQLLQSLALLHDVSGPEELCSRTLKLLSAAFTRFLDATRITPDQRMDCSATPFDPRLADVSNVPSMRQAARTGQAVVGYYRLSRTGTPLATIIEPVRDAAGRLRFYLAIDVEMSWFTRLIGVLPPASGTTVTLFDADGFVFARVPDGEGFVGRRRPNDTFASMAGRPGGFVEGIALDSVPKFYAFRMVPAANESPLTLAVGIPSGVVYRDADRNLRRNLLVAGVTLVLALMMAWIAADLFVIRDVRDLLGATTRVAAGDLTARVPTRTGSSELTRLADTFNQMAEHLEARRREFLALGDASPDAIVRITHDLRVDWANDALLRRLGTSLEAVTGVRITDIPVESDITPRVIELVRETLAGGERREIELQATGAGREGWVDLRFVPERDITGAITHVMLIARDVTARKHLEAHLAQAERLDSIGKLAGSISHDFNNLLTAIIGNTEIALRTLEPDHRARADLTEILDVSRRASSLTRQLLSFARRQPTTPRVIDVKPFIEEAATLLRRLLGEGVTLDLRLDPNAPRVRFDPTHLEQVLVNLATNGRDAMPKGGVLTIASSRATVPSDGKRTPDAPLPGEYLLLRVTDTGVGMSPAVQERIFEPFFTTKRDRDGTGLGLAVTYGVVRQHGGFIEVDSAEGAGTTFRIYFPATRDAADFQPRHVAAGPAPTGRETVLLVEDQDPVRNTIARQLRSHGYSVIEARDGVDVLRRWDSGELAAFQLVITDLLMPRMGGEPLARELRQGFPNVPILLISGFDERGSARRMLERGEASALLEKPFESEPLLRLVRELLDRSPAHAEIG
jgi:PAS domain S-box-containing protein